MQSGDIILKHECIGFVEKAKVYGKMVKSLHKVRERVAKEMLKSLPVAIAAAMQRVLAEHVGACAAARRPPRRRRRLWRSTPAAGRAAGVAAGACSRSVRAAVGAVDGAGGVAPADEHCVPARAIL